METVIKVRHPNLTKALTVLFLATLLSMCSTDETPAPIDTNSFGEVSGTISSNEGDNYSGIRVELLSNNQTPIASDVTNASGKYQLNQVPVGNYTLSIQEPLGSNLSRKSRSVSISEGQKITEDFNFDIEIVNAVVAIDPNDPIGEVINENGEVPVGNELLYTPFSVNDPGAGSPTPILAPDGHHVSLTEWKAARGTAKVTCSGDATNYQLEFSGLIPNGVYTLWKCILKEPQKPTDKLSFANDFEALGALKDAQSNILMASEQGEAQIELSAKAGALSMFGSQPACSITQTEGFILVLDYHIDGRTYGGTPGPDYLDVGHLLIFY